MCVCVTGENCVITSTYVVFETPVLGRAYVYHRPSKNQTILFSPRR